MSSQCNSQNDFKVEFTDILYGTVIAFSFNRIIKPELTIELIMFIFTLLIIMDDWLFYHLSLRHIDRTVKNYILCFVLDIFVLLSWYFITIVSVTQFQLFLVFTGVFFGLKGIWDIILSEQIKSKISSDILLAIYFSTLTIYYIMYSQNVIFILILCFIGFILFRAIGEWKNLLSEKELPI